MVKRKKRVNKTKSVRRKINVQKSNQINLFRAQKNFALFLILLMVSFLLYNFSINLLFKNFFGVLSIIFGFVTLAFLIALVVLLIVSSRK